MCRVSLREIPTHPEQSKLPDLINLALTNEAGDYRLRLNAASVLSSPLRQLHRRLRTFPTADEPMIYMRLIQFPTTKWTDDFELADRFAKVLAAVNRQNQNELLGRIPSLAELLFKHFHVIAYQELYCLILEDATTAFLAGSPNVFTGLVALANVSAAVLTEDRNYHTLYNIYGAVHTLAQNGPKYIVPFREPSIFGGLLRAAVKIGRLAIDFASKGVRVMEDPFPLVSYAFGGLQLLY
jgi:hypothetical protein